MKDWNRKNYLAPLTEVPDLDTSNYRAVYNSVYELQMMTGDNTDLSGKTIQELLDIQNRI